MVFFRNASIFVFGVKVLMQLDSIKKEAEGWPANRFAFCFFLCIDGEERFRMREPPCAFLC